MKIMASSRFLPWELARNPKKNCVKKWISMSQCVDFMRKALSVCVVGEDAVTCDHVLRRGLV